MIRNLVLSLVLTIRQTKVIRPRKCGGVFFAQPCQQTARRPEPVAAEQEFGRLLDMFYRDEYL